MDSGEAPSYQIVAHVSQALLTQLETYIGTQHAIVRATHWDDLVAAVRQQQVDLVVADPAVDGASGVERIGWLLTTFPSIAVVVYTNMTPTTFLAVHELSKRGLHRVMVYGCDDTPDRLALLFDGLPLRRMAPSVFAALRMREMTLSPCIQERMRAVYEHPARVPSVEAFTQAVGVSRRRLYKLFREAGLRPPSRFLLGAQLARACTYLRDPGATVAVIATKVGWTDPTTLQRSLERAFGMSMTRLRRYQPAEQLVERLADWIQTG